MSITFYPSCTEEDILGTVLSCYDHGAITSVISHKEADEMIAKRNYKFCCDTMVDYGPMVETVMSDEYPDVRVNLSNSNAAEVFELLGYEFEGNDRYMGALDPEDFLGRALIAKAIAPDNGTDTVTYKGEGGCTIIDCGKPRGYFERVMNDLITVAEAAKSTGRKIIYN